MGESSTMRTCNGCPVTNAVSKFNRLITLTLSFPNDGLGATPAHLPSFSMPKDEAMGKSSAKERRPDSIVALSCNSSCRMPSFSAGAVPILDRVSRTWTFGVRRHDAALGARWRILARINGSEVIEGAAAQEKRGLVPALQGTFGVRR